MRAEDYIFPVRLTARASAGSHHALSFSLEYDELLHGWQATRDSRLGRRGCTGNTDCTRIYHDRRILDGLLEQHSTPGAKVSRRMVCGASVQSTGTSTPRPVNHTLLVGMVDRTADREE